MLYQIPRSTMRRKMNAECVNSFAPPAAQEVPLISNTLFGKGFLLLIKVYQAPSCQSMQL